MKHAEHMLGAPNLTRRRCLTSHDIAASGKPERLSLEGILSHRGRGHAREAIG
jgi:hypothetical protein